MKDYWFVGEKVGWQRKVAQLKGYDDLVNIWIDDFNIEQCLCGGMQIFVEVGWVLMIIKKKKKSANKLAFVLEASFDALGRM